MLSANNVLSPAHGRPLVTPTQDMIIGAYYLTDDTRGEAPEHLPVYRSLEELERAYEDGHVKLHDAIEFRTPGLVETPANGVAATYTPTTPGRVFFNSVLPEGFEFVNEPVDKRLMGCLLYTSPSPRDATLSRMPSSA